MPQKNHLWKQEQWQDEQAHISRLIQGGLKVQFTNHFYDSLQERQLTVGDVYSIFKNGTAEIIQGHAVGTYALKGSKTNTDELRVVYGVTNSGKVIHVVMALVGEASYRFVTAYFPSPVFFQTDNKTLRQAWAHKEVDTAN